MGFNGIFIVIQWDIHGIYPLVNVHITMENHHAINGKIHYFYDHFQQQTVKLPEGTMMMIMIIITIVKHITINPYSFRILVDFPFAKYPFQAKCELAYQLNAATIYAKIPLWLTFIPTSHGMFRTLHHQTWQRTSGRSKFERSELD